MRLFRFGDKKLLTMGSLIRAYGEVRLSYSGEPELWQPRVKKAVADVSDLPKTLTPVYPASGTLTQPVIRKRIDRALLDVDLKDLVPEKYTKALNLPGFAEAVRFIHHPSPLTPAEALSERTAPEFKRLVFDEFLAQQIFLKKSRDAKALAAAPAMTDTSGALKTRFWIVLPLRLPELNNASSLKLKLTWQRSAPCNGLSRATSARVKP